MQILRKMLIALAALGVAAGAQAAGNIYVQVPATYETENAVRQKLKDECQIDTLLGHYVMAEVSSKFPGAQMLGDEPLQPEDYVLKLSIVYAFGWGGGGYSGSKILTIRADLFQDGKKLRSLVKRGNSRMGAFGMLSGTCSIFDRLSGKMAKHVLKWMVKPASVTSDTVAPAEPEEGEQEVSEPKG